MLIQPSSPKHFSSVKMASWSFNPFPISPCLRRDAYPWLPDSSLRRSSNVPLKDSGRSHAWSPHGRKPAAATRGDHPPRDWRYSGHNSPRMPDAEWRPRDHKTNPSSWRIPGTPKSRPWSGFQEAGRINETSHPKPSRSSAHGLASPMITLALARHSGFRKCRGSCSFSGGPSPKFPKSPAWWLPARRPHPRTRGLDLGGLRRYRGSAVPR